MADIMELDSNYSTTRRVIKADSQHMAEMLKQSRKPEDKLESGFFLPEGEGRQGEGGLRTQGYFKQLQVDKPLITVVTVVFNGEQFLEKTIISVINQTYDNVEYLIIDGGSTDGTLDIIRKYEHAIDYWVSEKDKGIYDAMNKGIMIGKGDIVGLINADDWYEPNAVEESVKILREQHADLVFGNKLIVDQEGRTRVFKPNPRPTIRNFDIHHVHPTVFVKKEVYGYFKYSLKYKYSADKDLLLQLYKNGYILVYHDFLVANMRTGGAATSFSARLESCRVSREHQGLCLAWINLLKGLGRDAMVSIVKRWLPANIQNLLWDINYRWIQR